MYDYVIVGAGSAGCVLAARLSEDPGIQVLLLEAGPPDTAAEIAVPAAATTLWHGPYAWNEATVPQAAAAGRRVQWPRGRTLGGSSSINGMVYVRGNRLDYDTWREGYDCTGWGYADLLPYFRRAEDQQRGESGFHGVGGPLRVEDQRFTHPFSHTWVAAATAAGLTSLDDFNGATQDGVGLYQTTQRAGRRWSVADAYLRPALGRSNLTVLTDALATRVLVERGRAVGVRYRHEGKEQEIRADREVLLCGGAVASPHLLLLSGIGAADQLRDYGIQVVLDVPTVGAGLADHPACFLVWETPGVVNLWEEATPDNMALWQRERRGPMASSGLEAGGFACSRTGLPAPDLQYGVATAPPPLPEWGPPTRRMASTIVWALDIRSRGRVALRSTDPLVPPAIDPGYLGDEADVEALLAGTWLARDIAARAPLVGLLAGEVAPGGEIREEKQMRAWIRRNVTTIFHPTSSCAMGGSDEAVCDPQLRVRGIDGLRVVDASVMPAPPRGNTNAPIIAIAERAADLIRGVAPLAPADPMVESATTSRT